MIKDFDKTLKNCYHGNQNSLLWALICKIDWKYIQVLLNARWIKVDLLITKIYIPNCHSMAKAKIYISVILSSSLFIVRPALKKLLIWCNVTYSSEMLPWSFLLSCTVRIVFCPFRYIGLYMNICWQPTYHLPAEKEVGHCSVSVFKLNSIWILSENLNFWL